MLTIFVSFLFGYLTYLTSFFVFLLAGQPAYPVGGGYGAKEDDIE
jgi:hypothetical protein